MQRDCRGLSTPSSCARKDEREWPRSRTTGPKKLEADLATLASFIVVLDSRRRREAAWL